MRRHTDQWEERMSRIAAALSQHRRKGRADIETAAGCRVRLYAISRDGHRMWRLPRAELSSVRRRRRRQLREAGYAWVTLPTEDGRRTGWVRVSGPQQSLFVDECTSTPRGPAGRTAAEATM